MKHDNVKKYLLVTSCQQIMTSWLFFQFMADLDQSPRWIPVTRSLILFFISSNLFSYFLLQKLETELKDPQLSFHTIALNKVTNFCQKYADFLKKKICWHQQN